MSQLKLAALDTEDLAVLSAHVQDAVLTIGDIRYLPAERRAVFVMNRFVWDKSAEKTKGKREALHERRRSALSFSQVGAMKSAHIKQDAKGAVLELLAITFEEGEAPAGIIRLDFAAGGTIRLDVDCIEAQLADLGSAWSTPNKPGHELD